MLPSPPILTAVLDLDRLCYPERPLAAPQLRKVVSSRGWVLLVDENASESKYGPLRYCLGERVREGPGVCLKIKRLGVHPDFRRRGLAADLLNTLPSTLALEVEVREGNRAGLELATHCGFSVLGLERGRFGSEDGITLWRGPRAG